MSYSNILPRHSYLQNTNKKPSTLLVLGFDVQQTAQARLDVPTRRSRCQ
ncbi:hypothetical protein HMPREF9069_01488 [Atopobium sp. oral taxon 810 str. F0209]|nr:hypothetical protein HMPREF9069_01488 [Atopobium sp. oral taxon 810 str. F0209]